MPAKSKAQQQAAAIALEAKRGERDPKSLGESSRSMFESMTEKELEEMASVSREDLPERVEGS